MSMDFVQKHFRHIKLIRCEYCDLRAYKLHYYCRSIALSASARIPVSTRSASRSAISITMVKGIKKKGRYDTRSSQRCAEVMEIRLAETVSGDVVGVPRTTARHGSVVVAVDAAYTRRRTWMLFESTVAWSGRAARSENRRLTSQQATHCNEEDR